MSKLLRAVDEFPGTLKESLGVSDDMLVKLLNNSPFKPKDISTNSQYNKFYNLYVVENRPLKEVYEEVKFASAFASDIIGTLKSILEKNEKTTPVGQLNTSKEKKKTEFDIYEYAKEYDADYLDNHTGYIYLVQEYNRAIKLGLPAIGIRVLDSTTNTIIGIAKKEE